MVKPLWMFVGSVPEDGDYHLVWATDAAEAMSEGRRVAGYDDAEYDDGDFSVHPATAGEILMWSPALVNRKVHEAADGLDVPETVFVSDGMLDTELVRFFLTVKVKAEEVRAVTSALTREA